MKIAEGLIQRADLQKRLDQLGARLLLSSKIQEGSDPPEEPKKLLAELDQVIEELTMLVTSINLTNSATILDDKPLTAWLAERELLAKKIGILRKLVDESSRPIANVMRSELRTVSTINVTEIRSNIDELSKQHRIIDTLIQGANWNQDLIS